MTGLTDNNKAQSYAAVLPPVGALQVVWEWRDALSHPFPSVGTADLLLPGNFFELGLLPPYQEIHLYRTSAHPTYKRPETGLRSGRRDLRKFCKHVPTGLSGIRDCVWG